MRRTSIFTASIVVVVLLGHATGARRAASNAQDNAAARQQLPAATRADVPQEVAPQGSQTDLSGTYHGVVTVVSTGETVPAVLKIEDGKFTLRLGDRETTGTIKPADGRDNSVVEMTFDDGSPFGADWACILRVSKVGSRLSLLAEPGARGGFSFQTGVSGERRPASADSNTANTSTSNVTTNRSANTSANTSAVSNMNRATRDSNSSGTRGEFPSTIFRNRNRPSVPRPTPESVFMSMPDLPTTMSAPPPRVTAPAHTPVPANASMPLPMSSTSPPPASNASASGLLPSTVRDIVEHLPGGELALDAPAKMLQGVPRIFTARVSFGDIGSQITEGMPSSATAEPIKVNDSMKVTLTAMEQDAFTITEKSDAMQVIVGKPYAEWKWEVTPLRSGNHTLHLNAAALITPPGQSEKPYVIPTKDRDINVQVNYKYVAGQYLSKYWSLLFGGVSVLSVLSGGKKAYNWWKGRGASSQ